jgi:uncharacterized protein
MLPWEATSRRHLERSRTYSSVVNPTIDQPLTDDELARLSQFLHATPDSMNIEMLDGYFTALVCGPGMVPPSECLIHVLGKDCPFENNEQAAEILTLLMRHRNAIATKFRDIPDDSSPYLPVVLPILFEADGGVAYGNDWAHGFMRGVEMRRPSWDELFRDENRRGAMLPVMMLHHEHDPDPEMRTPPIPPDEREQLIRTMIAALTYLYRYFEPQRQAFASVPVYFPVRLDQFMIECPAPKSGPDEQEDGHAEPCPCGSGLPYEACCFANRQTLH